ncbi:protein AF1q [Pristis pectinata]|uniref:protein AF1q n=1 Tax=Pristis pectinata TaxID=685728 RepID=UPI00223E59CE|nr:protein AF1q [Pristis pectinata]XP_051901769.1 protein AF1q [Pristis pectinata]
MLDLLSTQYDSFLFWRTPIPVIDLAEIEILVPNIAKSGSGGQTPESRSPASQGVSEEEEEEHILAEYNSFNFWRAPIASFSGIDLELL